MANKDEDIRKLEIKLIEAQIHSIETDYKLRQERIKQRIKMDYVGIFVLSAVIIILAYIILW
jgi:hypothetical protein